ncbi:HNH endonuclease [Shouchella patagoniensis]|uniref:HNH endonuclease n=1 Tax=Shouchella patagoniensis TaxID=228576 RepID=UPI000994C92C|nr:HNH endonuclease [Shouchella patagoniensis]
MPPKPLRSCKAPACGKLTREKYCEDHEHLTEKDKRDKWIQYDKTKRYTEENKSYNAFYKSPQWIGMREAVKRRDKGLCVKCQMQKRLVPMAIVDHIRPLKDDWSLRLNPENLQSLCHACHNIKTARENADRKR